MDIKELIEAIEEECQNQATCRNCRFNKLVDFGESVCFEDDMVTILKSFIKEQKRYCPHCGRELKED